MMTIKKPLKIILWIILAFIILLVVAAVALVSFVDPNDFKPQIISAVNNATGRQLSLPGKLSWTFYPDIGIHVGNASLSNPSSFSQNTFAQIDSADLAVSFWGLLQGRIQFDTLNLNGLRVFLIQERNQNNWTFSNNTTNNAPAADQQSSSSSGYKLSVAAIEINNGGISFDNYQTKAHYTLDSINLRASNVGLDHSFPVSFSTAYNVNQNINGNFKLNAEINFDQNQQILILKNMATQISAIYPTSTHTLKLTTYLAGDVTANLAKETINVPSLNFVINQIMKGQISNLQINNFSAPTYSGKLSTAQFSLKDLLTSLGINALPLNNKNILNQASIQSDVAGSLNSLNLSNLIFNLANSRLNGNINIGSFAPLKLAENLQLNTIDLADFINIKGARLPMQAINSSGTLSTTSYDDAAYPRTLNGNINLTVESIILKGFDLNALINSLSTVVSSMKNLTQLSATSSALQQQLQPIMNAQNINPNNGKSTDLGTLHAKININKGVITTPTMSLQGPIVLVNGTGSVNLTSQKINYELDARIAKSTDSFLQGLVIPYQIQGSFSNISQGLNWITLQAEILKFILMQIQQVVQGTVKQAVQQGLQQLQNGAQGAGNATDAAAKALTSIFGGGQQ